MLFLDFPKLSNLKLLVTIFVFLIFFIGYIFSLLFENFTLLENVGRVNLTKKFLAIDASLNIGCAIIFVN